MLGLVVLWLILALMSLALLVYLQELVTGRSCDDNDASPPARVRLEAVLPVGGITLVLAKVGRGLLDVDPGSVTAGVFTVASWVAVAGIVVGLLVRAWLSWEDAEAETESGEHTGTDLDAGTDTGSGAGPERDREPTR